MEVVLFNGTSNLDSYLILNPVYIYISMMYIIFD